MLTLAIETATMSVGCALGDEDGLIAAHELRRGRRHAESLAPAIELVLAQAERTVHDLTCIAVDVGPGLFTGLRVGLATATALATALDLAMVGVSSLDVLAAQVPADERTVVAVLDARRGEVFYNLYRHDDRGGTTPVSKPRCASPADLIAELLGRTEPLVVAGDGAARYFEAIAAELPGVEPPTVTSLSARTLLSLAIRRPTVSIDAIEPLYMRAPDAEISWDTRAGRHREAS